MTRRPFIAGNWKMFKGVEEARAYVRDFSAECAAHVGAQGVRSAEIALCVPFTDLSAVIEEAGGSDIKVFAQNMHQEAEGAYTGEVSAPMLTELGVHGVVLGHSERRRHFGETDRALQEKVPAALSAGLQPILCVGESEEERDAGDTERRLRHQVQEGLERVDAARLSEVVIAYEPIWAIGTGRVATPDQAQEAMAFVRALVGDRSEDAGRAVRLLYGGSVKPDNAAELLAQPDVDGALVGGASLDPADLAAIVAAAG